MRRAKSKTKTVGFGYVGRWGDGTLGWCLPTFLNGYKNVREYPKAADFNDGEPAYLCKITVQLVKGKSGKPIMRRMKK
jgi:hypothetical protein